MDTKICSKCGEEYPLDRFPLKYDKSRPEGARRTVCKPCENKRRKQRPRSYSQKQRQRHNKRARAIAYLGGKCSNPDCLIQHLDLPDGILDFHHRDSSEKETNVSTLFRKSWEVVKVELDKCDLLCVLCHRMTHLSQEETKPTPHRSQ